MTLLAALALASAAASADDFIKLVRKAESRGEASERIEYFTRAIEAWREPHATSLLASCHLGRGEAHHQKGDDKKALSDLGRAIDLDPRSAPAYLLRGRIHLAAGRPAAAAKDLAEYAGLESEDLEALLLLGEAERLAGHLDASLHAYKAAATLEPQDYRPALGRGRTLMAARDWRQAKDALDLAAKLSGQKEPEVFAERAVAWVALKKTADALDDYGSAVKLFERRLDGLRKGPELTKASARAARAYYGRGRLWENAGDAPKARPDYEAACRLGHAAACRRAAALAPVPAPAARAEPKPKPKPRPAIDDAESDPGERIYAQ